MRISDQLPVISGQIGVFVFIRGHNEGMNPGIHEGGGDWRQRIAQSRRETKARRVFVGKTEVWG